MPVASLSEYLGARRAQVDEALVRFLPAAPACPAGLHDAMRYSLDAGGKRLRPILTLAAADAIAGNTASAVLTISAALPAACAIELIHTYSLIHDDLPAMDDDSLRRGRPTNHIVYGEGIAILAGDGLLTEAFALMSTEPRDPALAVRKIRAMQVVATAAGACGMVGGQAIDLMAVGTAGTFTEQSLQDMHARKTGALIRAAAVAGAIMAGGTDDAIDAVEEYGRHLGLAFQIIDDILDVEGDAKALGKTAGKDARAGKPTYPSIYGLAASRTLAAECHTSALAALEKVGLRHSRLADIASWVIERTS
ncbi:MAG TPA: farnesyl diphosphate synthase [Vicinamibacterales bacterium]|nr:farnesyl diphosphate synthase [Vicinamibacterales bacterium]